MLRRLLSAALVPLALLAAGGSTSHRPGPAFTDLLSTRTPGNAYTPAQLSVAYDFKPLYDAGIDGTGQKVALIEVDSFRRADIDQFDATYALPAPHIKQIYVDKHRFQLEGNAETSMDMQWVHALAPGASIQIYYVNDQQSEAASWRSMARALHLAAAHGATTISISLGTCPPGSHARVTQTALSDLLQRGITVFVSSGDDGDHPGTVHDCGTSVGLSYPGSDPSVVAVGGTSLLLNTDNSIASETAWRGSGGGRDTARLRPIWQTASQLPRDRYRWAPDVAFLADPAMGVGFVDHGTWHNAGGTSLGAPAWAAVWSLIRQDAENNGIALTAAPPLLYRIGNSADGATAFHDIVQGSNGMYSAHPGWDAVTGWGTPDVAALDRAVQAAAHHP